MAEDSNNRISISEERLRAALAEMELRLRIWLDEQLKHKADTATLLEVVRRVGDLEVNRQARDRGELTQAQVLFIDDRIDERAATRTSQGWSSRERWMAVASVLIAAAMFVLSIVIAFHGGGF